MGRGVSEKQGLARDGGGGVNEGRGGDGEGG